MMKEDQKVEIIRGTGEPHPVFCEAAMEYARKVLAKAREEAQVR
jgi:hypothetical protein